MKRILVILIVLALITGCSRATQEPTTSTESTESTESSESSESSASSESIESEEVSSSEPDSSEEESSEEPQDPPEEEEVLPPAPEEPLRRLDITESGVLVQKLLPVGEGQLFLETYAMDPDSGPGDTKFLRIDIETGEVLCEGAPERNFETVLGLRANGELLTYSYDVEEINFYDTELQWIRTEPDTAHALTPIFDAAGDCFYALDGDAMYRIPASSSPLTKETDALLNGLRQAYLSSIDSDAGWFILQEPDMDGDKTRYTLYDGNANQEILSVTGYLPTIVHCGDHLLLHEFGWQEESSENWLDVYRISDGEKIASYTVGDIPMYFASCHTPYMLSQDLPEYNENEESIPGAVLLSNPAEGRFTQLDLGEDAGQLITAAYVPSTRRWLFVMEKDDQSTVWELAPDYIELDQEYAPHQSEETPEEPHTAGESLAECRAEADRIEAEFGVRILLGDEVLDHPNASGYRYVSIEDPENGYTPEYDVPFVEETLTTLQDTLALYPEGFFKVFKNRHGDGGVRFLLVRDLANDEGEFIAAGEQCTCGIWYNVSLDIDYMGDYTLHHELWHAVDSLLDSVDNGIDLYDWEALNPPGFSYGLNFETYWDDGDAYSDYLLYGEDPWFVSSYSLVTGNEDRATIIETVFSPYEYIDSLGDCTGYEAIKACPHLKAKLDLMAEKVNALFGYVYWEVMLDQE